MGIGPWAQGDLIRDIKKTERARFRRVLAREEKYLRGLIGNPESGEIMHGDLEGAFHRIRTSITAKRPREVSKVDRAVRAAR